MNDNKDSKIKVWKYAVILFTSAFVVLLLTAYSQIKFNRNIDNYRNQIYNEENEKNKYRVNLKTALDENVALKEELEQLRKELDENKENLKNLEKENHKVQDDFTDLQNNYEALLSAQAEYAKGNSVKSAEILHFQVDPVQLGSEAKEAYESLAKIVFEKTAYSYYKEGYSLYKKKQYSEATKSFLNSLRYSQGSYYSDDCYFFLAYSEYYQGNSNASREYIDLLLEKYPDTTYRNAAKNLKKLLP